MGLLVLPDPAAAGCRVRSEAERDRIVGELAARVRSGALTTEVLGAWTGLRIGIVPIHRSVDVLGNGHRGQRRVVDLVALGGGAEPVVVGRAIAEVDLELAPPGVEATLTESDTPLGVALVRAGTRRVPGHSHLTPWGSVVLSTRADFARAPSTVVARVVEQFHENVLDFCPES